MREQYFLLCIVGLVLLGFTYAEDLVNDDIPLENVYAFSFNASTTDQNNTVKTIYQSHQYYNSSTFVDEAESRKFWVDMTNHPKASVNDPLSNSYRGAATVEFSFDFPFYGYMVRNVTIATGGFLYTGDYIHSWLTATQYIAPLMGNYDTQLSNNSFIRYADNGTAFTVEWEKVVLKNIPDLGEFTFQVTLHKNGDIVFVYAAIPLNLQQIPSNENPMKVGLSDAYLINSTVFPVVRKNTIYEYHRINFMDQDIKKWTAIYLRALPTCLAMSNCNDCLNNLTGFECKWCPGLDRCSTGIDRYRQDWLINRCESENINEIQNCPATIANAITTAPSYVEHEPGNQTVH